MQAAYPRAAPAPRAHFLEQVLQGPQLKSEHQDIAEYEVFNVVVWLAQSDSFLQTGSRASSATQGTTSRLWRARASRHEFVGRICRCCWLAEPGGVGGPPVVRRQPFARSTCESARDRIPPQRPERGPPLGYFRMRTKIDTLESGDRQTSASSVALEYGHLECTYRSVDVRRISRTKIGSRCSTSWTPHPPFTPLRSTTSLLC